MLVRLNSTLRGATGRKSLEIDLPPGANVRQALAAAVAELPALGPLIFDGEDHLRDSVLVLRNGRGIEWMEGLETPLAPGHSLDLFPKSGMQRAFARE